MRPRLGSELLNQNRRRLLSIDAMGIAPPGIAVAIVLAVLGGRAISAQDKHTVQVPNGLAFFAIRGFEDWPTVAVSQAGDLIEVIVANPVMIGLPGRRSRQRQALSRWLQEGGDSLERETGCGSTFAHDRAGHPARH